jgi:hypothetical protein
MPETDRRRTWIWFFLVLAFLAVLAVVVPLLTVPLVHGLQPLTLETLQAARALWDKNGPRDYDMEYQKRGSVTGTFVVQVRHGIAVSVTMDGRPLDPPQYHYHTMPALFDDLETFLELASKSEGGPVNIRGRFDPGDGHILRYIRSVGGTSQQIEIRVKLRKLDGSEP